MTDQSLELTLAQLDDWELLEIFLEWVQQQEIRPLLEKFARQKIDNFVALYRHVHHDAADPEELVLKELLTRLRAVHLNRNVSFPNSRAAGQYLLDCFVNRQQEELQVLYLDTKNHLLQRKTLFKGTLNRSVVHPREIYKYALLTSSAALIIAHNHPSGDTQPSSEDLKFTRRVIACGELLGIPCLDHIIVGDQEYFSVKESQLI